MEFKGTKGKWLKLENSIGFVYALNDKKERNIFSLFINNDSKVSDEEIQANALLISKAPEILEMLNELISANPMHDGWHEKILKANKLIQEATEI